MRRISVRKAFMLILLITSVIAGLTVLYVHVTDDYKRYLFVDGKYVSTGRVRFSSQHHRDNNSSEERNVAGGAVLSSKRDSHSSSPEVHHIGFIKVHKAGSTTLQNILFRFGISRNLTFVLPINNNYFKNKAHILKINPNQHYDIVACHSVFSESLWSVLPADSVNIGIVRDPLQRMISAAFYYRDVFGFRYLVKVPKDKFIHSLVNQPEIFERNLFSYTRNSMALDFGFTNKHIKTDEEIAKRLLYLDNKFTVVLVMEQIDESLVLLRRALKWDILSILYLKTNKHSHVPVSLSDDEVAKFKNTSYLDYKIYAHFSSKLNTTISHQAPEFHEEVAYFKIILAKVTQFCGTNNGTSILKLPKSIWNSESVINRKTCDLMQLGEMSFINRLRQRHTDMQNATRTV